MNRKATWRVSCETCREKYGAWPCRWYFRSERGARNKYVSGEKCRVDLKLVLVLEQWDGERWVKQG